MPIVRLSRAMKTLAPGQLLAVKASDPAFRTDLRAWVAKCGHVLERFDDGPEQYAVVRKVEAA